jgi:hypothetical protein
MMIQHLLFALDNELQEFDITIFKAFYVFGILSKNHTEAIIPVSNIFMPKLIKTVKTILKGEFGDFENLNGKATFFKKNSSYLFLNFRSFVGN